MGVFTSPCWTFKRKEVSLATACKIPKGIIGCHLVEVRKITKKIHWSKSQTSFNSKTKASAERTLTKKLFYTYKTTKLLRVLALQQVCTEETQGKKPHSCFYTNEWLKTCRPNLDKIKQAIYTTIIQIHNLSRFFFWFSNTYRDQIC